MVILPTTTGGTPTITGATPTSIDATPPITTAATPTITGATILVTLVNCISYNGCCLLNKIFTNFTVLSPPALYDNTKHTGVVLAKQQIYRQAMRK